ncbi:MAG: dTMP kinase [Treponema sp.]|jgi:dTMP kinase|nr:dTMP kinase [Treponema sp.]
MSILQNFVVFEGADGSGTTTQLNRLQRFFPQLSNFLPLYSTCEPTSGPIGRLIRQALRGEAPLHAKTLAHLFAADRSEHLYAPDGIAERCARGELVVCDRYALSSLVYQGITCGDDTPELLNAAFPLPELLCYFDIDSRLAEKRMAKRPLKEMYEYLDFQQRVRERYHALLPRYERAGVRVERIDASESEETVARAVSQAVAKLPILQVEVPCEP